MKRIRNYTICADIYIDNVIRRGYYTTGDNWVFDPNFPEIEIFLKEEDALKRLQPILQKIDEGFRFRKIKSIYIINDGGFILKQFIF